MVFQDPSLDDELTAYENMEFHGVLYKVPDKILKIKIKELLNFVELWDRKNDIVKYFSGGMKRRLEIERGLLHTPEVLFMDEAERVADRVAIIDHGKIVAEGNPVELKEKTGTNTFEDAFPIICLVI